MCARGGTVWLRTVTVTVAAALAFALAAVPTGDSGLSTTTPAAATGPSGADVVSSHTVGLITGDTVTVQEFPDGNHGIEIEPAERDNGELIFDTVRHDGQIYVLPSDAAALVPDVLDLELFNVTKLVNHGYDLEHGLPVIATPPAGLPRTTIGGATGTVRPVPGVRQSRPLASIGAQAMLVEGGDPSLWHAVTGVTGGEQRTLSGPLASTGRVWLDELIEVTLADSAPMVGAPEAWDAGYDGTGLTVAVLDTGIDADHPDLAGRVDESHNFTTSASAADGHGHGTHVAGTIAGSGDASDGALTGVAPQARLLNGKVLGDNGTGLLSWILAGLEWAAGSGADLVNVSVGSADPSNGFDLMSQAVNQLTADHDVLFVVSAGNLGPGSWTIAAPGAASAALTVGAVDSDGDLPSWSSRGPRYVPQIAHLIGGEFTIKPDIAAPGVGIVAARAGGTSVGTPVGEHYTTMSGTSMAAPHVAGAAAILLQQRPDLTAAELKSALVTAAAPRQELTVYQQGGGLLDIPAALAAPVTVSAAPLDLGAFPHPYDDTAEVKELTYTNRLDEPLTLDLAFDVTSAESGHAGDAVLHLEPAQVELAPGESADVTVTLDPSQGEFGIYGGYLSATDGTGQVVSRVPTGFHLEPPTYTLRIEGIDRHGDPAAGLSRVDIADARDHNTYFSSHLFNQYGDAVEIELAHGTYTLAGRLHNPHPEHGQERSMVFLPDVEVTGDTTVVLDAREANRIVVDTPAHDTRPLPHTDATFGYRLTSAAGQNYAVAESVPAGWPVYVAHTPPPDTGAIELFARWLLATDDGGVLYDAVLTEADGIPAEPHYTMDTADLAEVTHTYHSDLPHQIVRTARFVELPGWEGVELGLLLDFNVPAQRVEYYVPELGSHRQRVNVHASSLPTFFTEPETFTTGDRDERSWFARPIAPGLRPADPPAFRHGDTLHLSVSPWVDPGGNAWNGDPPFAFFRDGELVLEGTGPHTLPLSPDPAEYRLEVSAAADRSWWQTSTEASTAWTLQSGAPGAGAAQNVPLLVVDYDLDVDASNTAAPPQGRQGPPVLGVHAYHQAGVDGPPVTGARLFISHDDGDNWRERPARPAGDGRFDFLLDQRDPDGTSGYVSLRLEAWDAAGNRIEQEIIRAFALAPRGPATPEPPGVTERVSVASDGAGANRGSQAPPAVSGDGRFVAFSSLATNLVPGDPDLAGGVFVHDRKHGTTERVSVASDGSPATGSSPAITPDGRYVAFTSTEPALVPDKTHTQWDVFVHDRETGTTERVSVASDGTEGNNGTSSAVPAISADGRHVAFGSNASNLVPGDTNNAQDVFVHDRETGTTERVSVAGDGSEGNSFSSNPSISADGRIVAFQSFASNLVPDDTNNTNDVFVHDRETGTTERVSVASDGTESNGFSSSPAVSAGGRHVGFSSGASNLVPDDTNGVNDIFVHDRETGLTERVSVASNGAEGNAPPLPSITLNEDGNVVAFASGASNLVPGDTNRQSDVFIRDRELEQ